MTPKKLRLRKIRILLGTFPALHSAAKRALQIGIETGTPVYVLKRGKIVDIAAEKKTEGKKI